MNCKRGDYAYIKSGELQGLLVSVDEIWWQIRATGETVWGVSSCLVGERIQFACSDSILRPVFSIQDRA